MGSKQSRCDCKCSRYVVCHLSGSERGVWRRTVPEPFPSSKVPTRLSIPNQLFTAPPSLVLPVTVNNGGNVKTCQDNSCPADQAFDVTDDYGAITTRWVNEMWRWIRAPISFILQSDWLLHSFFDFRSISFQPCRIHFPDHLLLRSKDNWTV